MGSSKISFQPWWAFACLIPALFVFNPYSLPEMVVGPMRLEATIVLLFVAASSAGMVRNERLEPRVAARLCALAWLGPAILFSGTVGAIGYLLPLAILAVGQWLGPFPEPSDDNPLAALPDWTREWIAFVATIISVIVLTCALQIDNKSYFSTAYRDIYYIPLFLGLALLLTGPTLVFTNLERRAFIYPILMAYFIALVVNIALTVASRIIAPSDLYSEEGIIVSTVSAMLLIQVMRHFHRTDALLKLAETYIGGIIVAVTSGFLLHLSDNSNFFAIFLYPALLVAIPIILFGLYLIWRKDAWLTRLQLHP